MLSTHAVGIDLGTTYSCLSYLNEHGEPITVPNKDGELSTPSVVLFDGDHVVVGTEALRNSIRHPDRVVVHAKRYMGNPNHRWKIAGKSYSPIDVSTVILKSMLDSARERIGNIERAVITVPAQFSDVQRQATAEAGKRAGLKHVDIINEPVAAALCFVLGTEGIWFTELATSQTIMVVDLGGGTFDLSLVRYQKNEVRVIASGGDLHLGGLDWNKALEVAISKQFQKEFGIDPSKDRESAQALALEAEQTKRSLSVRPKAALTCASGGQRKTYQVEVEQFERLTKDLVDRSEALTLDLLKEHDLGWAKIDVVLTTGGSSRMPMIRSLFKKLSGRTLNTSLSPDQSIAHGATYYAGMLLSNSSFAQSILNPTAAARLKQFKQHSATARALGVLIRDTETQTRIPHYILPANTSLPASVTQVYGTVSHNQRRVHLRIVESGTAADARYVELGMCKVDPLPENLPEATEIEVTIRYDEQARVHVEAKVLQTGQIAKTEIVRPENMVVSALSEGVRSEESDDEILVRPAPAVRVAPAMPPVARSEASVEFVAPAKSPPSVATKPTSSKPTAAPAARPQPQGKPANAGAAFLEESSQPVPLCNKCGNPLDPRGQCVKCGLLQGTSRPAGSPVKGGPAVKSSAAAQRSAILKSGGMALPPLPHDDDIIELEEARPVSSPPKPTTPAASAGKPRVKAPPLPPLAGHGKTPPAPPAKKPNRPPDSGEAEFYKAVDS